MGTVAVSGGGGEQSVFPGNHPPSSPSFLVYPLPPQQVLLWLMLEEGMTCGAERQTGFGGNLSHPTRVALHMRGTKPYANCQGAGRLQNSN